MNALPFLLMEEDIIYHILKLNKIYGINSMMNLLELRHQISSIIEMLLDYIILKYKKLLKFIIIFILIIKYIIKLTIYKNFINFFFSYIK